MTAAQNRAHALLRSAQCRADPTHLTVRRCVPSRAEFHAEAAKLLPFRVRKQSAGVRKRGQQPVVRAENQQNAAAAVAEHRQRCKLDGIADRGNRTDRCVLQQHGKQLDEQLRFEACCPQNLIHLLKCGNKRLIKLAAFLCTLHLSGLLKCLLLRLKASCNIERFQKCGNGAHLLVYCLCLCQRQTKRAQRDNSLLAQFVQRLQRGLYLTAALCQPPGQRGFCQRSPLPPVRRNDLHHGLGLRQRHPPVFQCAAGELPRSGRRAASGDERF